MAHIRQQIRDQAATELEAGIPEFKSVDKTRLYAYREDLLPSLNVITAPEESEPIHMGSQLNGAMQQRTLRRQLTLRTEIYTVVQVDDDTIDDELDRLAVEVEKIMEATLLNNLAADVSLQTTEMLVDAEGEVPVGIMVLTWLVIYRTLEGDPETSV